MEWHYQELIALCTYEAGKNLSDGVAEVREAVDFCRYYAARARELPAQGWRPLGIVACISPWNFPLAIFTGQVTAALVTGNAVIAKPAEQTFAITRHAVELMHEAGFPEHIVQCLPCQGWQENICCPTSGLPVSFSPAPPIPPR